MPPTGIDLHDAKAIVQWGLGVHLERAVPSGSGGATGSAGGQDFDLSEGGRRTGAMVVARSVATSHPQTWGSVTRLRWGVGGRRSWVIRLEAVTRSGPDERIGITRRALARGRGRRLMPRRREVGRILRPNPRVRSRRRLPLAYGSPRSSPRSEAHHG